LVGQVQRLGRQVKELKTQKTCTEQGLTERIADLERALLDGIVAQKDREITLLKKQLEESRQVTESEDTLKASLISFTSGGGIPGGTCSTCKNCKELSVQLSQARDNELKLNDKIAELKHKLITFEELKADYEIKLSDLENQNELFLSHIHGNGPSSSRAADISRLCSPRFSELSIKNLQKDLEERRRKITILEDQLVNQSRVSARLNDLLECRNQELIFLRSTNAKYQRNLRVFQSEIQVFAGDLSALRRDAEQNLGDVNEIWPHLINIISRDLNKTSRLNTIA